MTAADDGYQGSDPADGVAGTPRHRGALDLFRRILEGPPATAVPDESPRGRRRAVERLNERERRLSFLAALAAAVFAVVVYLTETHTKNLHLAKGQLQPQTTLALGLGASVLLGVAAYFGRRAPVAFVALFGFFIFSNAAGLFLGLPFLALGGWLFYRSFKSQRAAAAEGRAPAGASASGTKRAQATRASASRSAPIKGKGPGRPVANKRYTPKRPPPGAPKPSRRARKAEA